RSDIRGGVDSRDGSDPRGRAPRPAATGPHLPGAGRVDPTGDPAATSMGGRGQARSGGPVPRRPGGPLTAAMERELVRAGGDRDRREPRDEDPDAAHDGTPGRDGSPHDRRSPYARESAYGAGPGADVDAPYEGDADDDNADVILGARSGAARSAPAGEAMSFLRRVGVALAVLSVALGVGVGAGVVWEKVRPSGHTATAGSNDPTPMPTATAAAGGAGAAVATAPAGGGAAAAGTGQVAVPADWVAFTDTVQKVTFSHPPVWKQRRDNTGIFYGEPSTTAEFGPAMIGAARIEGTDQAAALTRVQAGEFAGVSGLTRERSGPATDSNGQPTQEIAGSYDREGQRVSYLMRTVAGNGAVYVLIARVSTDASASLNTLMGALRTSFAPAA
ncbi:LpqN/LpqT family lipoprotein, partial [Candidatus Frankia nodulisporulans]